MLGAPSALPEAAQLLLSPPKQPQQSLQLDGVSKLKCALCTFTCAVLLLFLLQHQLLLLLLHG